MRPLLFLDIDGVLNGHQWSHLGDSCTIQAPCIAALNFILSRADPEIVLSSAWRYLLHGKDMTLLGFGYLLRTHGAGPMLYPGTRIIGITLRDEDPGRPVRCPAAVSLAYPREVE